MMPMGTISKRAGNKRSLQMSMIAGSVVLTAAEMVETVRLHIEELGVQPTGFHYEKFIPAQPEAVAA